MPIKEYKCLNGHTTERLVFSIEDSPDEVSCKDCGKTSQAEGVSRTSFRLSPGGSGGFYKPSST